MSYQIHRARMAKGIIKDIWGLHLPIITIRLEHPDTGKITQITADALTLEAFSFAFGGIHKSANQLICYQLDDQGMLLAFERCS